MVGLHGTETLLSQRNAATNITILSGDFNDDDVVTGGGSTLSINGTTNNAYHVMITANLTVAAVIDGFTIKGGNADVNSFITYQSETFNRKHGGGMLNASSFPTITNATFVNNSADYGGGMYNASSSPTITNATFEYNKTNSQGGGMYNSSSAPVIINTIFSNNCTAAAGGGMYNLSSSPTITNATFEDNSSVTRGGGMRNSSSSSPTITNTIFWNNKKNGSNAIVGADIEDNNSTPTVTYCLTQANSTYSSGTGIINNQNPLFIDAANGDYTLQTGSPAINAGDGSSGSSVNTAALDLADNPRFVGVIDMGAYENDGVVLPVELLYFYAEKAENDALLSWETATEIDNNYFDIEWSTNGIEFTKIGQVHGAGTTNDITHYDFLHTSPAQGLNYYRLKQVDFNGKFEYTNILSIEFENTKTEYQIFPNPATDYIVIDGMDEGEMVQIFNVNGQLVKSFYQNVSAQQINISDLASGTYFIKMDEQIKKLIIQK